MAGYIDSVLPAEDQPEIYEDIRAEHAANGVPVSSWRSLVNVGLSLTQYVSEAFATSRSIARRVFRGMFLDSVREDVTTSPNAQTLSEVTAAAEAFALSQYQETADPSTLAVLRVELSSVVTAATFNFTSGQVIAGTPSVSSPLLYTLDENVRLNPGGRVVVYFRAQSPGSLYNLSSDAAFELKTTFAGVFAAVPSTGARLTIGTGDSRLSLSAGANVGLSENGEEVAIEFVVDAPSVGTLTITNATTPGVQTLVTVHMRSDGGSAPLSTADEIRAGLCAQLAETIIRGKQIPDGSTGLGIVPVSGPFILPRADGPIQESGQDRQSPLALLDAAAAKWDALEIGAGTDDALYYWGTLAPTGYTASPVTQIQVLNARKSDGTVRGGWITVLVSGDIGPLSPTDLAAVDANFYSPRKFAAFAKLATINATTVTITVTAAIEYLKSAKLTDADIAASISSALLALQRRLTMGVQTIDPSLVEAVVGDSNAAIWKITMSAPAAPTLLAWNERAEFQMSGFTYLQVDP